MLCDVISGVGSVNGEDTNMIESRGSYMSDHFILNLLNEPLASLINLI